MVLSCLPERCPHLSWRLPDAIRTHHPVVFASRQAPSGLLHNSPPLSAHTRHREKKRPADKSAGPWNERVGFACAPVLLPSTPRCQPGRMLGPTNMRRIKSLTVSPETNVISTAPTFRPHTQPVGLHMGLDSFMLGMNCRYSVGLPHLPVSRALPRRQGWVLPVLVNGVCV